MGHSANYAGGKGEKLGKWAKIRGNFDLDYFLGAAARFVISSEAVDSFGSTLGESLPRSSAPSFMSRDELLVIRPVLQSKT